MTVSRGISSEICKVVFGGKTVGKVRRSAKLFEFSLFCDLLGPTMADDQKKKKRGQKGTRGQKPEKQVEADVTPVKDPKTRRTRKGAGTSSDRKVE